jgi:hypothetical protein
LVDHAGQSQEIPSMLKRHFETTQGTDASDVPNDNTLLPLIGRLLEKPD